MSNVTGFTPRRDLTANRKFREFVDSAIALRAFGDSVSFHENIWDLTSHLPQKAKRAKTTINFTAWGQPRASRNVSPRFMPEPFLSFAKAYVLVAFDATRKVSFNRDMQALRAVCQALEDRKRESSPVSLAPAVLSAAAMMVKRKYSPEAAHGIGSAIERIASVVDELSISGTLLQWKNPIRATGSRTRVGSDFEGRRAERLPSGLVLATLGRAYREATHPEDIVFSSMCAIMLSSPDRANEVATMPLDCESSTSGEGIPGYALRWWPSKGAAPQLKAIPAVMQELVKDAIARIRGITDQGRRIAKFYEDQVSEASPLPKRVYLSDELTYLREKEFVTKDEISLILWGEVGHEVDEWCRRHEIAGIPLPGTRRQAHRFVEVERAVMTYLPVHFPYSDNTKQWKCSELLFTMQLFSNTKRRPFCCMYLPVDRLDLNYRLDGKNSNSIFSRLGLNEIVDGEIVPFKVTSHQFRHYLNHLAHSTTAMSDVDINLWSGRTERGEAYNHLTSEEISKKAVELLDGPLVSFPDIKQRDVKVFAREEFVRLGISAGHTTDFGYCVHDFAATPCQKHEECLDCSEQFCIKGDVEKERNLRLEIEELELLVKAASAGVANDDYGADRWLDRQKINLSRAREIIRIIDDPIVPYGSPIRLTQKNEYSLIQHVRETRMLESPAGLVAQREPCKTFPILAGVRKPSETEEKNGEELEKSSCAKFDG